jgi:predicted phosphodiesterase
MEDISKEDLKTLEQITNAGYSSKDIKQFIDALNRQQSNTNKEYSIGKSHVKFGVFGDNHIGHKQYDKNLMKFFVKEVKKQKVDFVLNTGDIFDGWYQNRPNAIFEQNAIGFDQQMKLAVKELSQLEVPLYFITGNHSYNTFVRGAGVEAGPVLEDKLNLKGLEVKYLGNAEGDIKLKNGVKIKLLHPDGGTAYALSYRPQKIIESLSGGEKPELLFIGHFHKLEQLFYRNVHAFQTGTFCGQTKFMRGKNIPAHKGFWIIDIYSKTNGGIDKLIPQLYPAYD